MSPIELIAISLALTFGGLVIFFVIYWFNRDPERNLPATKYEDFIISPSDGKILYINCFEAGTLPSPRKFSTNLYLSELEKIDAFPNGGYLIGIYLSPFDVHATRAPISGKVIFSAYQDGHFFSNGLFKLKTRDERSVCLIEGKNFTIGVVQMSAYIVRRVVLTIQYGDQVRIGQRIGRIKMGSQVDLILPKDDRINVIVKPGDRVRAGESLLGILKGAVHRDDHESLPSSQN